MIRIIVIGAAVCVGLYLLWENGYMVTQAKRAVKFIESEKGKRASFSFCTGFTRRRVNFKENKVYHFAFAPELSGGEVSAELLDADKQPLLRLTAASPSADVELSSAGRYYLVFHFQSASGKYALSWE